MPFSKIVKIIYRNRRTKFDNYDYRVLLECGHETTATFHHGEKVIGRRKLCWRCKRVVN